MVQSCNALPTLVVLAVALCSYISWNQSNISGYEKYLHTYGHFYFTKTSLSLRKTRSSIILTSLNLKTSIIPTFLSYGSSFCRREIKISIISTFIQYVLLHNTDTQPWTSGVRIKKISLRQLYELSYRLYKADFCYVLVLVRQFESRNAVISNWKKNQKHKLQLNSHNVYYYFVNS